MYMSNISTEFYKTSPKFIKNVLKIVMNNSIAITHIRAQNPQLYNHQRLTFLIMKLPLFDLLESNFSPLITSCKVGCLLRMRGDSLPVRTAECYAGRHACNRTPALTRR